MGFPGLGIQKNAVSENMTLRHKLTALAALAFAVLFNQFFMFTKHEPSLAAIIPFADDPYDAIGSMAMIISALLAVLSLFRAFRPHRTGTPTVLSKVFLARIQIAVPLSVLVALGADGLAMARHLSVWTGKPATGELLALLAGMAAISLALLFLIRVSVRGIGFRVMQNESRRAIAVVLVCGATLALFPENVIQNVSLHFLTIIVGFVLFFAPQSALIVALLPYDAAETQIEGASPHPIPGFGCSGVQP